MSDFIKNFSINILYAEDERIVSESIFYALSTFFTCETVENGEDALELFKASPNKYDLIITDVNMPKMDGLELAKHIKNINPEIPVIITTAYNDNDFLFKAIDIGVNQYVIKPLDVIKLIETINKTLEPILLKKEKEKKEKEYQKKLIEQAKFAAIGELSAGITHEINTPLTFMKSSFELIELDIDELEESNIKTSIKEDLETIKDGFFRLENIINSMKEMIGSNKKIRKETNIYNTLFVVLNIAVNKAKHISKIYINNELYELNQKKKDLDFTTFVNPAKIEQVWIIIINNALDELVKINEFDNRRLDINISKDDKNIIVKFKDNAGGIDKEILEKIFEPFKSTKDSSGMGIGLSIAKKIVTSHKGEITAYNENDGAVFEVKLPILKELTE